MGEKVAPTFLSVGVDEERWPHGTWVSKPQAAAFTVSSWLPHPLALQLSLSGPRLCPALPLGTSSLSSCWDVLPALTVLVPFPLLSPFCSSCLCVLLPVSPSPFCSASKAAIPSPCSQCRARAATLGVVPTSLSHSPQGLFLLLGESGLQRFWPWVLCEEDYLEPENLCWEIPAGKIWEEGGGL